MQKIRKKIADSWGIPHSAIMNIPFITLQGNIAMRLEEYKKILLYTENEIKILSKEMVINVYGTMLVIDTVDLDGIVISGKIEKIEYKE